MTDRRTGEWPLIIFTIGLQLCCGITLCAAIYEFLARDSAEAIRPLGIALLPLLLCAICGSLAHLGRPFSASRALRNLGSSRLSTEIAWTGALAAATVVYSYMWYANVANSRAEVGMVTAIVGIGAVLSSARIYSIPAQPLWNSSWLTASFFGATLLLGGTTIAPFIPATDLGSRFFVVNATVVSGAVIVIAAALGMLRRINRLSARKYFGPGAPDVLSRDSWAAFVGCILFAGLLPLAYGLTSGASTNYSAITLTVAVAALAGVIFGRMLMYTMGTKFSHF